MALVDLINDTDLLLAKLDKLFKGERDAKTAMRLSHARSAALTISAELNSLLSDSMATPPEINEDPDEDHSGPTGQSLPE